MKELKNKIAKILVKNFIFHGIELFPNPIVNEILSLLPDYGKQLAEKNEELERLRIKEIWLGGMEKDRDRLLAKVVTLESDYGSQPNKWRLAVQQNCSKSYLSELHDPNCPRCKGTGIITRTLTNDEVGELVQHYTNELRQVSPGCFTRGLFLPSGERVILLPDEEEIASSIKEEEILQQKKDDGQFGVGA